jgi:CRISPR system Cascade subunit CasC
MNKLLEIHIVQNFAPSNLNRDDTGSPKDALFGGVRRGRISSQCLKRAMRTYFKDEQLIGETNLALRTKRVSQKLVQALGQLGHSEEESERVVALALGGLKLRVDAGKSQYLLFLGQQEVERIAQHIHENWSVLKEVAPEEGKGRKAAKAEAKAALPSELVKSMEAALDGGRAVDVALFGRMLADLPSKNQDAAAQVAHAISTHKVEREFDFYTAVDDLQPSDTTGADMLGTIEFDSACYYRYAAVDLDKLVENLQRDNELAIKGVEAFLRASIFAEPTGKQNTFAAHNPPSLIAFTVRQDASPRSLANAFEKPVRPDQDGLASISMRMLAKEWERLDAVFGQRGETTFVNATLSVLEGIPGTPVESVEALVARTMAQVKQLLEV